MILSRPSQQFAEQLSALQLTTFVARCQRPSMPITFSQHNLCSMALLHSSQLGSPQAMRSRAMPLRHIPTGLVTDRAFVNPAHVNRSQPCSHSDSMSPARVTARLSSLDFARSLTSLHWFWGALAKCMLPPPRFFLLYTFLHLPELLFARAPCWTPTSVAIRFVIQRYLHTSRRSFSLTHVPSPRSSSPDLHKTTSHHIVPSAQTPRLANIPRDVPRILLPFGRSSDVLQSVTWCELVCTGRESTRGSSRRLSVRHPHPR
jgi:hypothetical protein